MKYNATICVSCVVLAACTTQGESPLQLRILGKGGEGNDVTLRVTANQAVFSKYKTAVMLEPANIQKDLLLNLRDTKDKNTIWKEVRVYKIKNATEFFSDNDIYPRYCEGKPQWLVLRINDYNFGVLGANNYNFRGMKKTFFRQTVYVEVVADADKPTAEQTLCADLGWYTAESKK